MNNEFRCGRIKKKRGSQNLVTLSLLGKGRIGRGRDGEGKGEGKGGGGRIVPFVAEYIMHNDEI